MSIPTKVISFRVPVPVYENVTAMGEHFAKSTSAMAKDMFFSGYKNWKTPSEKRLTKSADPMTEIMAKEDANFKVCYERGLARVIPETRCEGGNAGCTETYHTTYSAYSKRVQEVNQEAEQEGDRERIMLLSVDEIRRRGYNSERAVYYVQD